MGEIRVSLRPPATGVPERGSISPLQYLLTRRTHLLATGFAGELAPGRLGITEDWLFAVRHDDVRASVLFVAAGQDLTRIEAELAGLHGRGGVENNLAMVEAVLAEAGASRRWIAEHVDLPGEKTITTEFGRGVGRPANHEDDSNEPRARYERDRRRIRDRIARGNQLLDEYIGLEWRDLLISNDSNADWVLWPQ